MPELTIDQLNVHLSGLSEEDGRSLVRLIAQGFAYASLPVVSGLVGSVELTITSRGGTSLESLSDQIVADALRQVARSL